MSSDVELIVEQRQKILGRLLLGTFLVGGSFLLQDAVPPTALHGIQALTAIPTVLGVVVLLIGGWQMNLLMRRLNADKQLMRVVNDERVMANMLKATAFALGLLIVINSLASFVSVFAPRLIAAKMLAECNWLTAIVAGLGVFQYLDRAE